MTDFLMNALFVFFLIYFCGWIFLAVVGLPVLWSLSKIDETINGLVSRNKRP